MQAARAVGTGRAVVCAVSASTAPRVTAWMARAPVLPAGTAPTAISRVTRDTSDPTASTGAYSNAGVRPHRAR